MPADQPVFRFVDLRRQEGRSADVRVDSLDQASVRLPNFRLPSSGLKPQNLVGLLLGHVARSRRAALPRVTIKLQVFTPAGLPAVQISI